MSKYLSLIKFSHTIFAMPFAMIGFFLASEKYGFKWEILLYVILCMIFARSSAMAFNRYLDRKFDKLNPRTSSTREIPKGDINPKHALTFAIINAILFLITTSLINKTCLALSPLALLIVLGYSYTKRFTTFCHFFLGIGLSLAPIGAYLSVSPNFDIIPLLFAISVLCWVSGFDIIYSIQDEDFDRNINLKSIPVKVGRDHSLLISKILHLITISVLYYIGNYNIDENLSFEEFYWIGFAIFSLLLIYQHSLINTNNLEKINIAFFTTNGIGSVIFGIFVITDLLINN